MLETVKAAIFGHAVADALGVPAEFRRREDLKEHPITDMVGFGTHPVPKGSWSDDATMMLCTLESLAEYGEVVLEDIMRRFGKWVDEGYMTPHGELFDIGRTCLLAIRKFFSGTPIAECGGAGEHDNGNGSLMRIIPLSLYHSIKGISGEVAIDEIFAVSALTHAHERSCVACGIYETVLRALLECPSRESITEGLAKAKERFEGFSELATYHRVFDADFAKTEEADINSSGYVVDTLEAALWCLLTTENYRDCVLKAVNLGSDTDTTAAVAGGLAGILYGFDAIPHEWVESLARKDEISEMCAAFVEKCGKAGC
ncbi:MAG: ADP-ribosylglycohydrolase family protein [Oscillospiraceae bacterium]|nr:ADP-ribosylglycohydrolase family protein [Oscillospiraceae bacterium]